MGLRHDGSSPLALGGGAVGALIVGLVLVGCGDGNGSGGQPRTTAKTSSASSAKAAFVAKANSICKRGDKEAGPEFERLGRNPSAKELKDFVNGAYSRYVQGEIEGVKALKPPPGDAALVKRMLDAAQADLNKVKANPHLLVDPRDDFADFAKLGHPYGLTECDKGG